MFNLFFRIFSVLESNFLVNTVKKMFNKLPLVKPVKRLARKSSTLIRKIFFVSRLGLSNSIKYKLEQGFLKSLVRKEEANLALFKSREQKLLYAQARFLGSRPDHRKITSTLDYFNKLGKVNWEKLGDSQQRLWRRRQLYDIFKGGYRNLKLLEGKDNKLSGDKQPIGLFTNSSWLAGYRRGVPNGQLFTKTSIFTVQGLNDNMIDRMIVAPGAGKFLWNTLWLHKRRGSPDKKIKSIFSSAFQAEYSKRKQAFKKS